MKTSTKIFLILFIIFAFASILTFRFLWGAIYSNGSFRLEFNFLSYLALFFFLASLFFGTFLYIKFLKTQSFNIMLFFITVPLTLAFATLTYILFNINNYDQPALVAIRVALKVSQNNNNNYLWLILTTLIYLLILFFIFNLVCRPIKKVEKAVYRLSDGKVKDRISVGGTRQFKEIEFALNKINENYRQKETALRQTNSEYEKFIPKQFLKFFGKSNILELELGNQVQKEVTTMFCDIRNSTALSSSLSLEENFNFINSYLNTISPIIRKFGGFVDKYLGDGILAVFSKPEHAIECSKAIFLAIDDKNFKQKKLPDMKVGISINTGEVIFGVVGEEARKSLTIISDNVNLASKMDEVNKYFGTFVIFSKRTLNALPAGYNLSYRYIGNLKFKQESLFVFEDLDVYDKLKKEKLLMKKSVFESAVRAFDENEIEKAKNLFASILKSIKEDKVSYVYYNRCLEKLE